MMFTHTQIHDKYAENNGTFWILCRVKTFNSSSLPSPSGVNKEKGEKSSVVAPIFITSYLNTIHIRQHSSHVDMGLLNATIRVNSGENFCYI